MDYEKKYNEALERARRIKNGEGDWRYSDLIEITPALTEIFPELAENEDEDEQEHISDSAQFEEGFKTGLEIGLRKQKEQKPELVQHPPITYTYPAGASRDEQLKRAIMALLNSDLIKVVGNKFTKQDLIDWVEKQKPAEWKPSKEQLDALNFAITYFMHETNYKNPTELRELYDDLLKLK